MIIPGSIESWTADSGRDCPPGAARVSATLADKSCVSRLTFDRPLASTSAASSNGRGGPEDFSEVTTPPVQPAYESDQALMIKFTLPDDSPNRHDRVYGLRGAAQSAANPVALVLIDGPFAAAMAAPSVVLDGSIKPVHRHRA
jgi:hypothetical protein